MARIWQTAGTCKRRRWVRRYCWRVWCIKGSAVSMGGNCYDWSARGNQCCQEEANLVKICEISVGLERPRSMERTKTAKVALEANTLDLVEAPEANANPCRYCDNNWEPYQREGDDLFFKLRTKCCTSFCKDSANFYFIRCSKRIKM